MDFSSKEIFVLFVSIVASIMEVTIIIEVLASWFGNPFQKGRFRNRIEDINRPFLGTIRRFLPGAGGLDFSPLVAILILEFIPNLMTWIFGINYQEILNKLSTQ